MLRKMVIAAIAAVGFGVTLAGAATPASAEWGWNGPRYGYDQHRGYGHSPPWVRRWHWWRRHHWDRPAHHAPRPGYSYGRPVPPRPYW